MKEEDLDKESIFWADQIANKLLKKGKKSYVVTCGTSPSGVIHVGKLREVITTEFVFRALKEKGVDVKFVHSYDNFDRFRKVPEGQPESYKEHIGKPLTLVPDSLGCHQSYAQHFEDSFIKEIDLLGIKSEPVFQSEEYQKCTYKEGIKIVLQNKEKIKDVLNKYKTSSVPDDWWPISLYCEKCDKDFTKIKSYDGEYILDYECFCGHKDKLDFSKKGRVKLIWRVDWPMRWEYYKVDYEPGGKDHFSPGSSYDTGEEIVKIFNYDAPDYSVYNQIKLKGQGVKMSSSLGNVITITNLLDVYYPEIIRFLYAGTKPNKEFDLPLDEDVIKVYEDFYKVERIYFGVENLENKKKEAHLKRVYEMSIPFEKPKEIPVQPSFRKAVNLSQIYLSDEEVIEKFGIEQKTDWDKYRLSQIIKNARYWVENHAPEKYKFRLMEDKHFEPTIAERKAIELLLIRIEGKSELEKEDLQGTAKLSGLEKDLFKLIYKILLNKDRGPRVSQIVDMIGFEKFKGILSKYK